MKSSGKQNFKKPVAGPCRARAKIHNMACSANRPVLAGRSPTSCSDPERHTGIQLIAGPRMGSGIQHTTKSTSKESSQVVSGPPKSLSYLLHQSSFSFNFLQQLLPLGDVFHQRRGRFHGILQLPLEHESRTASAGAVAAPSHLQSHPSTPPAWSQLAVPELCSQGSSVAPIVPCRRQHHALVTQLLLLYVLCATLQHSPRHSSQDLGLTQTEWLIGEKQIHPAEQHFSLIRADGDGCSS